jgi:hypothetical protein
MDKQYEITGIIKTKQKVKQRCVTVSPINIRTRQRQKLKELKILTRNVYMLNQLMRL